MRRIILGALGGAGLALAIGMLGAFPAAAQQSYPTGASGVRVGGVVPLQCNTALTSCTPATASNPAVTGGDVAAGSADTGNPVKIGGVVPVAGSITVLSNGQRGNAAIDAFGNLRAQMIGVQLTGSDAWPNNQLTWVQINGVGTNAYTGPLAVSNYQYNGSSWDRLKKASTVARLLSAAATTNSTLVKASAGDVFAIELQNLKASAVYLKLYNKASAPTCGTDTPVATFYLAPTARYALSLPTPLYFGTGLGYCLTGAAADADTTALVAGDVVALNVIYQ